MAYTDTRCDVDKIGLRVVADGANQVGDTLTRLSVDFFRALGYDDCRVNIHKTGREIDIKGRHAFENRSLVAECKAQKTPIGGSDINKFVGVLDAERRKPTDAHLHGYFISLSGYTESAREQEEEFDNARLILLDGSDIANRISTSGIVVTAVEATEAATRFISKSAPNLTFDSLELIAHALGWMWAVYFRDKSTELYACLVHADGEIVDKQQLESFKLEGVTLLGRDAVASEPNISLASRVYRDYIATEYGAITLEGMPADHEVGSRAFRLENMYVPLEVEPVIPQAAKELDEYQPSQSNKPQSKRRSSLGDLLSNNAHVSILGPPGSGKSTLIKRLAVAYSDAARLQELDDGLPDEAWFPLAVKCRHLGASAGRPMTEIIQEAFLRAERPELSEYFAEFIGERLRVGQILLLVDGLDEIPSPSGRSAFVSQLRTFLARYPSIRLVITSREVGFRHVAGAVYSVCSAYKVSELDSPSIALLVSQWHKEVIGRSTDAERTAERLTAAILRNDRVRRLAINPLLLTTLLLVQRWVGQLPRKRTVLYQKAIEVLLMTWNVEGHEPIDLDEALPQLSYAAYRMMMSNTSSVSGQELATFFKDARRDMPELLAYSKISAQTFLTRVEERSSLLIQSGFSVSDGEIVPIYEFKHLTFQEYLAAQALANRWLPADLQGTDLGDIMEPLLENPYWSEVVRMTTVLSGRVYASKIVRRLIGLSHSYQSDSNEPQTGVACSNLIGCLGDDVPVAPELAADAIRAGLINEVNEGDGGDLAEQLTGSRYNAMLKDICLSELKAGSNLPLYGYAFQRVVELNLEKLPDEAALLSAINTGIRSENFEINIEAASLLMAASYNAFYHDLAAGELQSAGFPLVPTSSLRPMLDYTLREIARGSDTAPVSLTWMQAWALAWGGIGVTKRAETITNARSVLFEIWIKTDDTDLAEKCSWAFGTLPMVGSCNSSRKIPEIRSFLKDEWRMRRHHSLIYKGVLVAGLYFDFVWPPSALAEMAKEISGETGGESGPTADKVSAKFIRTFLKKLRDKGAPLSAQ